MCLINILKVHFAYRKSMMYGKDKKVMKFIAVSLC
jgi:hypothetical protein